MSIIVCGRGSFFSHLYVIIPSDCSMRRRKHVIKNQRGNLLWLKRDTPKESAKKKRALTDKLQELF